MDTPKRPVNAHKDYHAHVYFDQKTLSFATDLSQQVEERFQLKVGRVHQKPVGPHTRWSFQILFDHHAFDALIPWLDQQRNGLSVLVHAQTGNSYEDHTTHAYWLGDPVDLKLKAFSD